MNSIALICSPTYDFCQFNVSAPAFVYAGSEEYFTATVVVDSGGTFYTDSIAIDLTGVTTTVYKQDYYSFSESTRPVLACWQGVCTEPQIMGDNQTATYYEALTALVFVSAAAIIVRMVRQFIPFILPTKRVNKENE